MDTMDTIIDFKTAQKEGKLDLVDWPTQYGDFKFYVRKGLNEVKYNVGQNFSRNPKSGEYIRPFVAEKMGEPLDLNEVLNQEDTWLDVGGHMGLFAIRMARQFPKIKKIVSYEALPQNVTFAIENIKVNGITNCEVIQKAIVPNNDKTIDFYLSADSGKHSTLQVRGRDVVQVPAVNVNDVLRETGATAIKVDIEGAEYELIKAIEDWSNIRVAVIEWHFNAMKPAEKMENARVKMFQEIMAIMEKNFDVIRKAPNVEYGKNFITHFACIKTK